MKKRIVIASAITAGAAAVFLLLKKKQAAANQLKQHTVTALGHPPPNFAKSEQAMQEDKSLSQGI